MERATTCCFTGHRPEKLPWGEHEDDPRCVRAKEQIAQALKRAYEAGFRHFMCGMAKGGDFYFAQAVLELRKRHPDVTLEGVRPYEKQADSWSPADRERYWAILDQCDYETLVQHHYDRFCMMRRNRYMVDRSARIIALYNGQPKGGTAQTLAYALGKKLETEILHPEEEE